MLIDYKNISIFIVMMVFNAVGYSEPFAIVGGNDGSKAYAAFVDPDTNTAGPVIKNIPIASGSKIKSVWINNLGEVFISGVSLFSPTTPYSAFVDFNTNKAGSVTSNLPPTGSNHYLTNGQINDSGQGIIAGGVFPGPYAAFVDVSTNTAGPTITNLPSTITQVGSVAINNSGKVLISGDDGYAVFVDISTNTAGSQITNIPLGTMQLQACAINKFNQALIGGRDGVSVAYAAFVDINTNAAGPTITNIPTATGSHIGSLLNQATIPGNGVAMTP